VSQFESADRLGAEQKNTFTIFQFSVIYSFYSVNVCKYGGGNILLQHHQVIVQKKYMLSGLTEIAKHVEK
jgi:hypothetical protein